MTALIIITLLSIAAFVALWIACRMASREDPCRDCPNDRCTECSYWKEMTGNG